MIFLILLIFSQGFSDQSAPKKPIASPISYTENPCSSNERWVFSDSISNVWQKDFYRTLKRNDSSAFSFSNAIAMRQLADTDEARSFAEYWVSRALLDADLIHIAYNGFLSIASRPGLPISIQSAALGCLLKINDRFPTLELQPIVTPVIEASIQDPIFIKVKFKAAQTIAWDATYRLIRKMIVDPQISSDKIAPFLALLQKSGPYEAAAQLLWNTRLSVQGNKKTDVLRWGQKFAAMKNLPYSIKRHEDILRILIGRAYFEKGYFDLAQSELRHVKSSSNELAHMLADLAWAKLQAEEYTEAVGTALNLQTGGLRNTFTPEAPMVMAMALNELCQYPQSIRAIQVFLSNYEKSYFWLENWKKNEKTKPADFYKLTIAFLKGSNVVPTRVASEWVRSPLFISRQEEINSLIREKSSASKLTRAGDSEQNRLAVNLLNFIREVKTRYDLALIKLQPGQALPQIIQDDLKSLQARAATYRRFRMAAPIWSRILANHESKAPGLTAQLVKQINMDLKDITKQMHTQIENVATNNDLIEIEIFNGASQDLIWRNAHPDYEKVVYKLKEKDPETNQGRTWNWGNVKSQLDEGGEIWEDELGDFKADLYNNCSNKDKYLAFKQTQMIEFQRKHAGD